MEKSPSNNYLKELFTFTFSYLNIIFQSPRSSASAQKASLKVETNRVVECPKIYFDWQQISHIINYYILISIKHELGKLRGEIKRHFACF